MSVLIATGHGRLDDALAAIARRRGTETFVADDGTAARGIAMISRPRLTLLGENLPGESGWLVCAKLRIAGFRGALILTGVPTGNEVRELAAAVGAARYWSAEECEFEFDRILLDERTGPFARSTPT